MRGPPKAKWVIEGREGVRVVWRTEVPLGRYSERQMQEVLRLLVASAELSFDEIIASTGRKRKSRAGLLEIHQQMEPYALIAGNGWSFTARVIQALQ